LALLFAGSSESAGVKNATSAISADMRPIRMVITLIEEMKVQCEKDAEGDLAAYDKFMCWCQTNEKEKGKAIEDGKAHVEELNTFLEEAAAKEGELKTLIASLEKDIEEDKDALATATATREKEFEAFQAAEADMKETKSLLREAVEVLEKVQLVQRSKGQSAPEASRAREVLLQLRDRVEQHHPKFQGLMQKDLFDVFGSLEGFVQRNAGFLPRRAAASFEQEAGRLLPWEKTEEQMGKEAKPNELKGAAAGAKSYNSRSGGILGLLAQMEDQFSEDLSEAQKADFIAEVNFQNLRAAKLGEIEAATKQKEDAETELANLLNEVAKAKRDVERTLEAIEADENFLANMRKECEHEETEYKKRAEIRSQELVALGETIKILTEDSARELYDKTMSFLQVGESSTAAAQERAVERAVGRIAKVAKKHKNWALVSLAVRVRLDAFTKVKEAMDKMHAELAKQQKEEYAKWELCKKEIDKTEDDIKVSENTKEDLDEKHLQLSNKIDQLNKEIAELKKEEEDLMVSLKQAGEQRKEQNEIYQTSVMNQRAMVNILNKALARLKKFYQPGAELVEVSAHEPNQPGFAVAPKPKSGKAYEKSAGSGGVIQLLMKVIEEAEIEEQEMAMDEQKAQEDYGEFVSVTTTAIEKDRALVAEKTELVAETESEKSETEEAQLSNDEALAKLRDLLKAHHIECDYVLKYFDIRQKSRQEEMDAITDAKAVLSGANFGK